LVWVFDGRRGAREIWAGCRRARRRWTPVSLWQNRCHMIRVQSAHEPRSGRPTGSGQRTMAVLVVGYCNQPGQ